MHAPSGRITGRALLVAGGVALALLAGCGVEEAAQATQDSRDAIGDTVGEAVQGLGSGADQPLAGGEGSFAGAGGLGEAGGADGPPGPDAAPETSLGADYEGRDDEDGLARDDSGDGDEDGPPVQLASLPTPTPSPTPAATRRPTPRPSASPRATPAASAPAASAPDPSPTVSGTDPMPTNPNLRRQPTEADWQRVMAQPTTFMEPSDPLLPAARTAVVRGLFADTTPEGKQRLMEYATTNFKDTDAQVRFLVEGAALNSAGSGNSAWGTLYQLRSTPGYGSHPAIQAAEHFTYAAETVRNGDAGALTMHGGVLLHAAKDATIDNIQPAWRSITNAWDKVVGNGSQQRPVDWDSPSASEMKWGFLGTRVGQLQKAGKNAEAQRLVTR